jgi:hypothetical protein
VGHAHGDGHIRGEETVFHQGNRAEATVDPPPSTTSTHRIDEEGTGSGAVHDP